MPQLSLFLLGAPRLELGGEPLDIGRRKAVALVAYLAVTGQAQARDTLATLLWPEFDQSRARAALRRTLSTLNRALGGVWLRADRETINLECDEGFWVDVAAFRRRLARVEAHGHPETEICSECLSYLAEAAALYRDDFMAGFTLRDSPEFDDWQFFQAESLRRELADVLELLVCGHCAQGALEPFRDKHVFRSADIFGERITLQSKMSHAFVIYHAYPHPLGTGLLPSTATGKLAPGFNRYRA